MLQILTSTQEMSRFTNYYKRLFWSLTALHIEQLQFNKRKLSSHLRTLNKVINCLGKFVNKVDDTFAQQYKIARCNLFNTVNFKLTNT